MAEGQAKDDDLKIIETWMEEDHNTTIDELKDKSLRCKRLAGIMFKIVKRGNLVMVKKQEDEIEVENFRTIVPKKLEEELVEIIHSNVGMHLGKNKNPKRILRHFYLPVPTTIVNAVVSKCLNCARKEKYPDSKMKKHRKKLNSYQASFPLECLFIDNYGPFNSKDRKNKACLIVIDAFTGFLWLIPVTDFTGKTVAEALETKIFTQFGPCHKIVSNNAQAFKSSLIQSLCKRWNIYHSTISPYNSSGNKVEIAH